ncbi:hypothetical protein Back11_37900 [Paenibacillus baekrokdamisoli]|uniref:Uncharacterized protein n=1 Tax=Paenibacillus baekrokdamisoli TaxID=1712516 RepID=A0A3G9J245_9BACL|nr:hypothetical protein Back11_37900 [Paenibacillus baekrokdamisoli]
MECIHAGVLHACGACRDGFESVFLPLELTRMAVWLKLESLADQKMVILVNRDDHLLMAADSQQEVFKAAQLTI